MVTVTYPNDPQWMMYVERSFSDSQKGSVSLFVALSTSHPHCSGAFLRDAPAKRQRKGKSRRISCGMRFEAYTPMWHIAAGQETSHWEPFVAGRLRLDQGSFFLILAPAQHHELDRLMDYTSWKSRGKNQAASGFPF